MITTINLNPCIDKSMLISDFRYGGLNRVLQTRSDVSGKAINVGIAIKRLGFCAECLGFNYDENGNRLEEMMEFYEIPHEFVAVRGKLRTNTKVLDQENQTLTEFNESGGKVAQEDIRALKRMIRKHVVKSSVVVIAGSVPLGVGTEIYKNLIEDLADLPVKVILDAEKELLREGIKAAPYMIKPNLYELQSTFGTGCSTKEEICSLAREIIDGGVKIVCVSMGRDGAVICDNREAYFARGLELEVKGVQGAGDSMVAGMCVAMEEGLPIQELLRYGMAASAGSLVLEGTQMCGREQFDRYLGKIEIERI